MSDSQRIYKELKLISNYLGLITAKYVTIILLAIVYYPMRPTPAYILATIIICPLLIRYALSTASQTDASKNFILYPTARKYGFTMPKYKAEKITYPLIVFFMVAWQLSINHYNVYAFPIHVFPSVILIVYIISRPFARLFFRIKLHYDFMHMNNI